MARFGFLGVLSLYVFAVADAATTADPSTRFVIHSDDKRNWADANAFCADTYGTTLATISNDAEAEQVLEMVLDANCGTGASGTRNTWIGLNDLSVQGTYEWVSGEECDGDCIDLDWWHPNQPSSASQRCISIRSVAESIDELFNDGTCSNELCFVCDSDPTASSTSNAHYVAQGRTSWSWGDAPGSYCQNDDDNQAAHYSSKHGYDIGVGCCSQDGSDGYRPDCDAHPATYQEAVDLCENHGYRLCTVAESESGITEGTGCWYDALYQWTSDSCGDADEETTAEPVEIEHLSNQQCYVYETEYDGDRLDNPIFEGSGFIGSYTLDECWAHCEVSTDSEERPCVAIEWSDRGDAQLSTTSKDCALAWGCDYTEYWLGGSVYQITGAHYVAQGRTSWSWGDVPDHYCQSDDDDQAAYYAHSSFGYDIGVGCCSEDGSNGYRPDCNAHPATYQEAVALCNENGYRLCTVEESESGITEGSGCSYDAIYQWTSDSCDMASSSAHAPQHGIVDWVKANIGGGDLQKTVDTDAVVVLTAKDLVILVLLGTALVLVTALIVICIGRSGRRTKYAPVAVVSDSEVEKFRN